MIRLLYQINYLYSHFYFVFLLKINIFQSLSGSATKALKNINFSSKILCKNGSINSLFGIFFLITFTVFAKNSFAEQKIIPTNYFASLRSNETNVRSGPGPNYPIKFTFKIKAIPVRVINEYDNWSEIEDYEGQTGWVSQSLITKKRTLMLRTSKSFVNMHSKNNEKSRIFYRLENNVIGDYIKCLEDWCAIKINNKKGWVQKVDLYGVSDEENL